MEHGREWVHVVGLVDDAVVTADGIVSAGADLPCDLIGEIVSLLVDVALLLFERQALLFEPICFLGLSLAFRL